MYGGTYVLGFRFGGYSSQLEMKQGMRPSQPIIDAASRISIKGTVAPDGTPLCEEINFQPRGDFYGTIYAPDAEINMQPNGDFYGAIVGGHSINMQPGGSYYFIPSLLDTHDIEILYMGIKHGSWWEEGS